MRILEYNQVRDRIFNNDESKVSNYILKTRENFKAKKEEVKNLSSSIVCLSSTSPSVSVANDPRPYAQVSIGEREMSGLLESGAEVSILGKNCLEIVNSLHLSVIPVPSTNITTADGTKQKILGKIITPVKYNNEEKEITFFLVPNLDQELYLGVDFWREFQLAPDIISSIFKVEDANLSNAPDLISSISRRRRSRSFQRS